MVRVADVEYVVFGHTDLARMSYFLTDFGMKTVSSAQGELLMRGAGEQPYVYVAQQAETSGIRAIGMRVNSMDDLKAAAEFPESSPVEPIARAGGGHRVRLTSPDGIPFELTYGIARAAPLPMRDPLRINHAREKRRNGAWQRPQLEPAQVLRLGHVALTTAAYKANAHWLETRLGMKASDILFDGTHDNALGGFFHCRGGGDWVDHHTIALFPSARPKVHHCSFEVQDLDAQFLGNKYMLARKWRPLWGVGRHILGSQIFDYWFDPDGNVVEHFTDGDLVAPEKEAEFHQISDDSLAQWGPPIAVQDFVDYKA